MPSRPSPSSTVQAARHAVAGRLRELRELAGLSPAALSQRAGWSRAKTSRLENGVTPASADDIRSWCQITGATDQVADLLAARTAAEGAYVEWRRLNRGGLAALQSSYLPLYERTRVMRVYQSHVIPGMVQTEAYAAALLRLIARFRNLPDDSAAAAAARTGRQRLLRAPGHRFAFILEEAVLRQGVGGRQVMAEQLHRLQEVARQPNVSVGIIPAGVDRPLWTVEGFTLYDADQAHVELLTARITATAPSEVAIYSQAFAELAAMAVHGERAAALIRDARDSPT